MLRVMYASVASAFLDPELVIQDIVDKANTRNRISCITGALIYTGNYFAQVIEGPDGQIRALYESIKNDGRHSQLRKFLEEKTQARAFQSWGLVYSGFAGYVNDPIGKIIRTSDADSTEKIKILLMEFAKIHRNTF